MNTGDMILSSEQYQGFLRLELAFLQLRHPDLPNYHERMARIAQTIHVFDWRKPIREIYENLYQLAKQGGEKNARK